MYTQYADHIILEIEKLVLQIHIIMSLLFIMFISYFIRVNYIILRGFPVEIGTLASGELFCSNITRFHRGTFLSPIAGERKACSKQTYDSVVEDFEKVVVWEVNSHLGNVDLH